MAGGGNGLLVDREIVGFGLQFKGSIDCKTNLLLSTNPETKFYIYSLLRTHENVECTKF